MTTTTLKRFCMQLCVAIPGATLALVPLQAHAQEAAAQLPKQRPHCADGIAMRAAAALGHTKAEDPGIVCKPMPSNPARSIVALFYVNGADGTQDDDSERDYDLDVLIVNSSDGKVLKRLHLDGAFGSDADRFTGIDIDTANYQLAPGVRAFGLTISHEGSSSMDHFSDTELRLFAEQNGQLRQVLDRVRVKEYRGEGGRDCSGRLEQLTRTIASGKTGTHGLADLVVSARSTVTNNVLKGDECIDVASAPTLTRTTLHYNGEVYLHPAE